MRSFILAPSVARELRRLAETSAARWGEARTYAYLQTLYNAFQHIADRHEALPTKQKLTGVEGLQPYRAGSHYVIFKPITADTVAIVAILHERMDVSTRLQRLEARINREIADVRYKVLKNDLGGGS